MVLIVLQVIFLGRCLVYPQNVVPLQCEHSIAHAPGMAARWRCRAMVFAYVLRWGLLIAAARCVASIVPVRKPLMCNQGGGLIVSACKLRHEEIRS